MTDPQPAPDPVQFLRETFRRHLEAFYAAVQLAPPYHSVEKAITELTKVLHTLPIEERRRVAEDLQAQWLHFAQAFVTSGLNQKHRGILAGLARRREVLNLPAEYASFLDTFL
ncbi:hypothetical protein YTPLAS18_04220 [Nitrospira sp.]|nr:hypothetical protein YTPLAS18_04220 [Nitrospira sp.]